jgi:hypothetical protein
VLEHRYDRTSPLRGGRRAAKRARRVGEVGDVLRRSSNDVGARAPRPHFFARLRRERAWRPRSQGIVSAVSYVRSQRARGKTPHPKIALRFSTSPQGGGGTEFVASAQHRHVSMMAVDPGGQCVADLSEKRTLQDLEESDWGDPSAGETHLI